MPEPQVVLGKAEGDCEEKHEAHKEKPSKEINSHAKEGDPWRNSDPWLDSHTLAEEGKTEASRTVAQEMRGWATTPKLNLDNHQQVYEDDGDPYSTHQRQTKPDKASGSSGSTPEKAEAGEFAS